MSEELSGNRAAFRLEEICNATGGCPANYRYDNDHTTVEGVVTDSRVFASEENETSHLFVALRGEKFDGHKFLPEIAIDAMAALVEVPDTESLLLQIKVSDTSRALGDLARYHRQRFAIPLVAVTGSYGKTSTRALIHAALSQKFNTLTSQGNFNNEIGLPMTLFQLESEHQAAVLEMGMRGRGQIEYLAKIALPSVTVITNIGPQHIELLGSIEAIAAAKAELLENSPADGLAVLPADSPFLPFLQSKAPGRVVMFGASEWADYRVQNIQTRENGDISCEINRCQIEIPLPGAHNALNAAAAFAVARELGVEIEKIKHGLETAQLPGARMRVLKLPNGVTVIDDSYNAGPDSMRAALQTLLDFPSSGRKVAVLGAMKELGEFSESEHRKIGAMAGQFVERLIGVGGETRPLLNSAIVAAKEVESEMQASYCEDANEAASRVGEWIQSGDVVLVKGSRSVGLEVVVEAVKEV
ncbi:MAG: UDP-N-acetylmuramoyl-tripeptide--D-alanyl-D-alanine ligase [Armatimonadetes bacterium]|nr:UDP-N-acetylmuramoyl-tripeptide--D-alanyl-D-alanine ligase [Armatimonadota bacterium]